MLQKLRKFNNESKTKEVIGLARGAGKASSRAGCWSESRIGEAPLQE
ncbi:MAG: hypothetical protein KF759_12185 [Dokdonella sp.]|nr:hypothetical protein [Dokdonella sp.]